jgi:hypothetical protein
MKHLRSHRSYASKRADHANSRHEERSSYRQDCRGDIWRDYDKGVDGLKILPVKVKEDLVRLRRRWRIQSVWVTDA